MEGNRDMAARKQSATIDLKVRMKEPLRAKLAKAAAKRGVSMNTEAVDRLEYTFVEADMWGGATTLNLARLWAAKFVQAGERAGRAKNLPPDAWVDDRDCFLAGLEEATKVLSDAAPSASDFPHAQSEEARLKFKKFKAVLRRTAAWRHVRDQSQQTTEGGDKAREDK
jgi:hypothetical protein